MSVEAAHLDSDVISRAQLRIEQVDLTILLCPMSIEVRAASTVFIVSTRLY